MSDLLTSENIAILSAAFTFGLVSNLHCIGMCGPLVLSSSSNIKQNLIYQVGRLISYLVLGFILYSLSSTFFNHTTTSIQQFSLYFLIALYFIIGLSIIFKVKAFSSSKSKLGQLYQRLFQIISQYRSRPTFPFLIGLLSGLLPCGLLHTFLLGVIPLKSPFVVFSYITVFWVATSPALLSAGSLINFFKSRWSYQPQWPIGLFYMGMGFFLVYMRQIEIMAGANCH